jgi:hypothetical protein
MKAFELGFKPNSQIKNWKKIVYALLINTFLKIIKKTNISQKTRCKISNKKKNKFRKV